VDCINKVLWKRPSGHTCGDGIRIHLIIVDEKGISNNEFRMTPNKSDIMQFTTKMYIFSSLCN
jgi:hypothetical protein